MDKTSNKPLYGRSDLAKSKEILGKITRFYLSFYKVGPQMRSLMFGVWCLNFATQESFYG
ncbi:hypothetical protein A3F65_00665 [Candidatus Saccharibacteria bacterium RIFCSPHIGHO2_12_FULL_47_16b]|nr:MAG: hypothetical protein A3F65_00665 [Candidatus Saccharibacteria bacterium RIFCSPHIGHO2_12_FULL_47_16b]